ncbi:hypothetical protein ACFFX1_16825 [Dactylosporangium sucinum]|uniref:Uncharacterized protein n=1 Tax=Dactylosporangium sucinum TaxID=1424081 RepID=A0A917TJT9_9ACTN|nr:hypothetical protein [Dactylosporangium sucinum]GGM26106.1 hypothetical protein GCM10007977_029020 [Dactylosporangium sucinum]
MADRTRGPIRRHLPLILLVAFVAWIVVVIVLIAVSPDPGGSNPTG